MKVLRKHLFWKKGLRYGHSPHLKVSEIYWGSEDVINYYKAANGSNSLLIFIFLTINELSGIMLDAGYKILKLFGIGGSIGQLSGAGQLGFESCLFHLLVVWLCANYLSSCR